MLNPITQIALNLLASAGAASIISLLVGKRFERDRWLRDRKLEASQAFLKEIYGISGLLFQMHPGDIIPNALLDRLVASEQGILTLISSKAVIEAAQDITQSIASWVSLQQSPTGDADQTMEGFVQFRETIARFTIAVRADLKTDRHDKR